MESRKARWTGRILSALGILFLAADGIAKVVEAEPVIAGTVQLGYSPTTVFGMGVVLLLGVAIYAVPTTAVLGAVLLTGYLGGAVATHVRVGNPWASHILFPTYVAALLWGGLLLRDARLRALFPWRTGYKEMP